MRDERRHSACLHVDRHRQALGYLAPWTYVNREVSLPEPVLDLLKGDETHPVVLVYCLRATILTDVHHSNRHTG